MTLNSLITAPFISLQRICYLALIILLFFASSAQSDPAFLTPDELDWLNKNDGQIDILFGYQAPPNAFHNEKGEYIGFLVDALKEIEQVLGVKFKYRNFTTWNALI